MPEGREPTSKRGPNRTPGQRLADMAKESEWYCQGIRMSEIGRRLGISIDQVSYDLKTVRRTWSERATKAFSDHIAEELAKLDELERQAWQAWYWSTQSRKSAEREKEMMLTKDHQPVLMANGTPKYLTTSKRVKVQARDGNPDFLAIVYKCIDRRIKMLGLDAPIRVQQEVALRELAEGIAAETGVPASQLIADAERIAQAAAARQGLGAGLGLDDEPDTERRIAVTEA